MKKLRQILPALLIVSIVAFSTEGCWMFHGKNRCGDCPNFKTNSKPKKQKKHHH